MLAVKLPIDAGVPVISPVLALIDSPEGKDHATSAHDVTGRSVASVRASVPENDTPTLPVKLWPAVIRGTPAATASVTFSVQLPPGPTAVTATTALAICSGAPVIAPVVALIDAQEGNPVADQLVAGRFVPPESVGV